MLDLAVAPAQRTPCYLSVLAHFFASFGLTRTATRLRTSEFTHLKNAPHLGLLLDGRRVSCRFQRLDTHFDFEELWRAIAAFSALAPPAHCVGSQRAYSLAPVTLRPFTPQQLAIEIRAASCCGALVSTRLRVRVISLPANASSPRRIAAPSATESASQPCPPESLHL
ncbi:hypothetical protein DFH06DRAFT_173052 [Mycena polygramma]|nr:hypothetical protein DFH06DRAFT_173052 [Mycena polygramma]